MTIWEQMNRFGSRYGKQVIVNHTTWHYYRLGAGAPIFLLPGGLRRSAFGFAFMEKLAERHVVIAPDYPPVRTMEEFTTAFDAILAAEGIDTFALGGQSYGGLLAQAYLAHKPQAVKQLILSSTGPADYSKAWLPAEYAVIALLRLLPERTLKSLLTRAVLKVIPRPEDIGIHTSSLSPHEERVGRELERGESQQDAPPLPGPLLLPASGGEGARLRNPPFHDLCGSQSPEAERAEWVEALHAVIQHELSRADMLSHFAVAADVIRKGIITPAAYQSWTGRLIVLSAKNDPTQSSKDVPRYEKLFGRTVEVIDLGNLGHAAPIFSPDQYVELLEQALA